MGGIDVVRAAANMSRGRYIYIYGWREKAESFTKLERARLSRVPWDIFDRPLVLSPLLDALTQQKKDVAAGKLYFCAEFFSSRLFVHHAQPSARICSRKIIRISLDV